MCTLIAEGPQFDVDRYLLESGLRVDEVWRVGEPWRSPESQVLKPERPTSGFRISLSGSSAPDPSLDELEQQFEDATRYLSEHDTEMQQLSRSAGVTDAAVRFVIHQRGYVQRDWVWPEVLAAAGEFGFGLVLTFIPEGRPSGMAG